MGRQIWPTEAIENILWAIQAMIQVTIANPENQERSIPYCQGFNQGFAAGFQRVIEVVEEPHFSQKIWTQDHIQNLLRSAQIEIRMRGAMAPLKAGSAEEAWGFAQGLETSLWCLAMSFGVNLWPSENGHWFNGMLSTTTHPGPWFHEDVLNILRGIQAVLRATVTKTEDNRLAEFGHGFQDGLRKIAHALGIRLLLPGNTSFTEGAVHFWLRQDIQQQLQSAYQDCPATISSREDISETTIYWQGVQAAVQCVAQSFGIKL